MPNTEQMPATDSAREIHDLVGDDSTATFESNPDFIDNDTDNEISSDNLQERKDREEVQNAPSLKASAASEPDEDDDDLEDDEDDDDLEDDEDDEDDLDDDELDDDDLEDDDEDDEEYDDDDDDEDEDDDADEVAASSSSAATLRADGLLGYEDEADDAAKGRSAEQGNADRLREEEQVNDGEPKPIDRDELRAADLGDRTGVDGENTEATLTGEVDPAEDDETYESVEDIQEQDTDAVADKALRMSGVLAAGLPAAMAAQL